ncbi:MAG: trypsin-like peptidase domain-containing protein [Candidatus Brocadiae bacterium]|nr:trypsin-like peptidase domain-containing protein [Candidatus Brocadiia bacterium]
MRRWIVTNVLLDGLLLLTAARLGWCEAQRLTLRERVSLGKAATALVEIAQGSRAQGTGSAFCVHKAGLFITNRHVLLTRRPRSSRDDIRKIPLVKRVTLVISSGETGEREVEAKVLRVSDDVDLALLKVEGAGKPYSHLTLGSVDNLMETAEVMAFGFPFGEALAVNRGAYPSISVNAGRVTSLRRKGGELSQIQVDAVLNPGNSGGPVLDAQGKVIGVVVTGVLGMGVNFAIPVSRLRQFLDRPEILFAPPTLKRNNQHDLTEFRARVVSLLPTSEPLTLQLTLKTRTGQTRHYDMKPIGDAHRVEAVPIPPRDGPLVLQVEAVYADGYVRGGVQDRVLKVGDRRTRLSEVRSLRFEPEAEVVLSDGKTLRGKVTGLDAVPITVGEQSMRCKLDDASMIEVDAPTALDAVFCTIIARQAGKEVGRITAPAYVEGAVPSRGLVAYLSLDERGGDDAKDLSGNDNHARVVGARRVPGVRGRALSFGKDGDQLNAGNRPSLQFSGNYTLMACVKPEDSNTDSRFGDPIISKEDDYRGFQLTWDRRRGAFGILSSAGSIQMAWGKGGKRNGEWYFVAGAFENGSAKVYVNGELESSVAIPRGWRANNREDLLFGSAVYGMNDDRHLRAVIDEIRIYNVALKPEEIRMVYRAYAPPAD